MDFRQASPGSTWAPVLSDGKSSPAHDVLPHAYKENGWTQHEINRINRTVKYIQKYTGVILPTINGCPVFVHIATAPPTWGWRSVHRIMYKSLQTMTVLCNKWWETVETAETLLLECVFQVSVRRMVVAADDPQCRRSLPVGRVHVVAGHRVTLDTRLLWYVRTDTDLQFMW